MISYTIDCSLCGRESGTAWTNQILRHVHRVTSAAANVLVRITMDS